MPPRRQPQRKTQTQNALDSETIARRTQKHLDELERSNYSEAATSHLEGDEDEGEGSSKNRKGRARVPISDKRQEALDGKKKKSSHDVRSAVLYRKNLATLIDESGIADLPPTVPTYLTAAAAPSPAPARMLCSVCGYWGNYRELVVVQVKVDAVEDFGEEKGASRPTHGRCRSERGAS
ncbi:unnamed protein product [Peniophora sp. CBMAI 1063]|nr:unnamed protein product [Peniophora sp. CBMAI 1063]